MKTLAVLSILFISFAFACKKDINPDQTLEVKFGESINHSDYPIKIKLDSVLNESRCPKGTYCFWAGNAEVRFTYSKDNEHVKFKLNTNSSFRVDTLIDGYRIKLLELTPYPEIGKIIRQQDYKAELEVTRD